MSLNLLGNVIKKMSFLKSTKTIKYLRINPTKDVLNYFPEKENFVDRWK